MKQGFFFLFSYHALKSIKSPLAARYSSPSRNYLTSTSEKDKPRKQTIRKCIFLRPAPAVAFGLVQLFGLTGYLQVQDHEIEDILRPR